MQSTLDESVPAAKDAGASSIITRRVKGTMKTVTWLNIKSGVTGAFSLIVTAAFMATAPNSHGQDDSRSRAASLAEIQQLFKLATAPRPPRCQFEADIELTTPPFTKTQVETALAQIEKIMQDANSRMNEQQKADWRIAQSNAIVKAHSGKRVLHIREWYSGAYYRLDINDEGMGIERFLQAHPNEYYETYVNIPNSPFSEYSSYQVNRNLRDIMLFKQERPMQQHKLWQAFRMHGSVPDIIIVSLADMSSAKRLNPHEFDLGKLELDETKAQQLHDQTDSRWRLEAFDESLDGKKVTRFTLQGGFALPAGLKFPVDPITFQAEVWIGQVLGKTVCLQERATNSADHESVFSRRAVFNGSGSPTEWTLSTVKGDSSVETKKVVFKRVEMNATFTDEEAFAPVFPPDYIVSDVSSGTGALLQKPDPGVWLRGRSGNSNSPPR